MRPSVSVIMPVKNAMPYLSACLDSILNQTFKDWELIAVNDGSDDDSEETLLAYARSDSRICVYNNSGTGIIPALQLAYKKSSGNYIHRMDADDLMLPEKLQSLLDLLKE